MSLVAHCEVAVGPGQSIVAYERMDTASLLVSDRIGNVLRKCEFVVRAGEHVERKTIPVGDGYVTYTLSVFEEAER